MESAESLRRSISIAEQLRSVVRTMKVLASVNIRAYERSAQAIADYNRTVEMGLQVALREIGPLPQLRRRSQGQNLGAIVFGSDQGMCGMLNDQVVSHATRALDKFSLHRDTEAVLAVGGRAAAQLESRGRNVDAVVKVPTSLSGVTAAVEAVLARIEEWRTQKEIELVVLFYARPTSGAGYRVVGVRLLPIDPEWIKALEARSWPSKVIPMFTMDKTELFQSFIREYLFVSLFRALAESLTSENASRLASMQAAERNIDDRLRALTAESRQIRHSAITSELLDIIASFEALQGKQR